MSVARWGLLPVGSVEAHGPHLPVNTDTLIAEELARRLAPRWPKALARPRILPSFMETACSYAKPFKGTVDVPAEKEEAELRSRLRKGRLRDVDRVLILNVHFDPVHTKVLRSVAASEEGTLLVDLTRRQHAQRIGGEFATGSCHAGSFETSLILALDPTKVNASYRTLPPVWVDLPAAMKSGKKDFIEAGAPNGYCGEPAMASEEEGKRLYEVLVDILLESVAKSEV